MFLSLVVTIAYFLHRVWREYKFPVCDKLLWKSQEYLCGLVVKFVKKSWEAASKAQRNKVQVRVPLSKEEINYNILLGVLAGSLYRLFLHAHTNYKLY